MDNIAEVVKVWGSLSIGFFLAVIVGWADRRRRLKTQLAAQRAELRLVQHRAKTYRDVEITSPLYRLPQEIFRVAFPIFVAEGILTEDEAHVLGEFSCQVSDINRGLDQAAEAAKGRKNNVPSPEALLERNRLVAKVKELIEANGDQPSLYDRTLLVIESKMAKGTFLL